MKRKSKFQSPLFSPRDISRNADRPVTVLSDGTRVHFPPYPFGYHTPEALLAAMRSSLRVLGLDPGEVVFAVASDDPGWCRENLEDPTGELNVVFTSDYHKKSRREYEAGKAFVFFAFAEKIMSLPHKGSTPSCSTTES